MDIADIIAELVQTRTSLTRQLSNALVELEKERDNAEHWKSRYREVSKGMPEGA